MSRRAKTPENMLTECPHADFDVNVSLINMKDDTDPLMSMSLRIAIFALSMHLEVTAASLNCLLRGKTSSGKPRNARIHPPEKEKR